MGHVHTRVRFEGSAGARELNTTVDTASTYTVLPPALATELGVPRLPRKLPLRLANGHTAQRRLGR